MSGFLLSDIFTRYFEISKINPSFLITDNSNQNLLSEIFLKICKIFPNIFPNSNVTIKNLNDLKKLLIKNLKDESLELFSDNSGLFVDLFLDYHKIQCFFMVYNGNQNDVVSFHIGYFDQLKCIQFCKDFKDIKKLVLKDTSISKYFDNDFDNFNIKGDKNIINNSKNNIVNSDSCYINVLKNFYKTNHKNIREKFKSSFILNILDEEIKIFSESINKNFNPNEKLMKIYKKSFDDFGDFSVVYSYLKIRELQIREILYFSDKLINNYS